jgi:mannose-6-phosphate isomerase
MRSLQEGTAEATVAQYEPQRGEVLFIPGGLVHAVGGGCRLYEVQQTSDTTWRLHDWNRVDAKTGLPRPIHVQEGLAAIDWSLTPPMLLRARATDEGALISCASFRFFVREFSSEIVLPACADGFRILFSEEGACAVRMEGADPVSLSGDVCALIPAGGACTGVPSGFCRLLIAER